MSELQVCPICGSKEFTKFYHDIIVIDDCAYGDRVEYYECDGCSVHFSNPRKFLIKKEKNN